MPQAPDGTHRSGQLHLAFLASPVSVRDCLARMLAEPPLSHLSDEGRGTAELVLAEVLNNVVEHAYADQPGPVAVTLRQDCRGVSCLIVDEGAAMPGGTLPKGNLPDTYPPRFDDLPEGGFGWHLIRSLTQDLRYQRRDGCNKLAFTLPKTG
jgi:serine/threonine-protein kinase RsbW